MRHLIMSSDSKNCYGMVQVGFYVQFYKYERYNFSKIKGQVHLINDANSVVAWGRHTKNSPCQSYRIAGEASMGVTDIVCTVDSG